MEYTNTVYERYGYKRGTSMAYTIGIDIGSTCSKAVVLEGGQLVCRLLQSTGWSSVDTAETLYKALAQQGYDPAGGTVVATGYGRISVPYANRTLTEITCHARGACFIHGCKDLTVVDIGGQDTKCITVTGGVVSDFVMNDKCSAGTGRFLEVMANTLGMRPGDMCELARQGGGVSISSMCTVFAESEVISLIGRGEPKENIAFGVVDSIVQKVASQCGRIQLGNTVALTGGLCECGYIREALEKALQRPVMTLPDGRYAGAVGAALSAAK